jgi:hypothetical protein
MTDDLADIPPVERASGFLACISAAVWLWTIPACLFASLRDGRHPQDDAQDLGADWANEGAHIHPNMTGAKRNHG